jgi:hypothetical protein
VWCSSTVEQLRLKLQQENSKQDWQDTYNVTLRRIRVTIFAVTKIKPLNVDCGTVAAKLQPCHSQLTLHARNIPNAVCGALYEDEQEML